MLAGALTTLYAAGAVYGHELVAVRALAVSMAIATVLAARLVSRRGTIGARLAAALLMVICAALATAALLYGLDFALVSPLGLRQVVAGAALGGAGAAVLFVATRRRPA